MLFFLNALSIAIAGVIFLALSAIFFERLMPYFSGKAPKDSDLAAQEDLFDHQDGYFDVLLNSGQLYQHVRYERTTTLGDPQNLPSHLFAVMRYSDGRKLLVRLDAIRTIEGTHKQ